MRANSKHRIIPRGEASPALPAESARRYRLHVVASGPAAASPPKRSRSATGEQPPLDRETLENLERIGAAAGGAADATSRRRRRPWPLPERRQEREFYKASALHVARRLLSFAHALGYYAYRRFRLRTEGRDSPEAQAVLLCETLEQIGGTFVKLGQQLSARLDLLPFATCQELSKMLDAMPPFPAEQAIAAIERTTGKPLDETFSAFDPKPLGSASIGCVYHGILRSGEHVAVKVRRPGIGKLFAADLAALDLVVGLAELLTLIRPGFTRAVRVEIRTMLMEELDFHSEARYQELFRQQARRDGQPITAPKVYYEHCGKDVIVSEFVKGVWLQDLIAAKEQHDDEALRYCASLGIDPETVARRLLQALYWSNFENSFYHADPHPANLVVRPGNELVFLDFGACGPTTHRNRRNYMELFGRQDKRDIDGMVQVFGNIISPLPPVNLDALQREGEALTARWQYGFDSEYPEWWERSSAGMWIGMLELTRRFNIPVTIETVRLVRSSLLYDTIAARLSDTINMQREFAVYRRAVHRRTLQRMRSEAGAAANPGRLTLDLDRLLESLRRHLYGLERFADQPLTTSKPNRGRWPTTARAVALVTAATGLAFVAASGARGKAAWHWLFSGLSGMASNPWPWAVVALLSIWCYRMGRHGPIGAGKPMSRRGTRGSSGRA